jgi:hypothetical protein
MVSAFQQHWWVLLPYLPACDRDVVSKHLVPLLLHAKERGTSKQMYTFAKLFTQLTFSPDKDHPFDTRSDMYRYLETHKRACLREGVMSAFMSVMIEPLENAANEITTSKDVEKIELMLTLFTNLFKLPSKLDATVSTAAAAATAVAAAIL